MDSAHLSPSDTFESNDNAVIRSGRPELQDELLAVCRGRDLSDTAFDEIVELYLRDSAGELRAVIRHLRHIPKTTTARIDICEDTTALLLERLDARDARIIHEATERSLSVRNLAWALRNQKTTRDEFTRRCRLLLEVDDPETPGVRLFTRPAIRRIVNDAISRTRPTFTRSRPPSLLDGAT